MFSYQNTHNSGNSDKGIFLEKHRKLRSVGRGNVSDQKCNFQFVLKIEGEKKLEYSNTEGQMTCPGSSSYLRVKATTVV